MFPDDVLLVSVGPRTPVVDALQLMLQHRYSQLPVLDGERLLGVFSHWSMAGHLAVYPGSSIADLTVDAVIERLPSVTVKDPLDRVLEALEKHDAVVVMSPRGVQAIATPVDVLRYLFKVARPYVLLQEIELGLRDVISSSVTPDTLPSLIDSAVGGFYRSKSKDVPRSLDELTFEDYRSRVCCTFR